MSRSGTAAADTSHPVQLAVCVTGYLRTLQRTWPSAKTALFCAGTARYPCADAFLGLYYSSSDTAIHSPVPGADQIQEEERFIAGVRNQAEVRWLDVSIYNESHHAVHGSVHAPFISQGRRVGHCLKAVHAYQTAQRRAPYSLVMRTRTDVVYPAQPFPIDQLLEALRGTTSCAPLLVPLANDGRGVNDQIALGALSTMEQYGGWGDALASTDFSHGRTYHSRRVPPHEEWYDASRARLHAFATVDSARRRICPRLAVMLPGLPVLAGSKTFSSSGMASAFGAFGTSTPSSAAHTSESSTPLVRRRSPNITTTHVMCSRGSHSARLSRMRDRMPLC